MKKDEKNICFHKVNTYVWFNEDVIIFSFNFPKEKSL